jgi:hypothetical protein
MSKEKENVNPETTAEETVPEVPVFETGFLVLRSENGNWHVLTDLSVEVKVNREPDINEVRMGASETSYALGQQQLAAMVLSVLAPQPSDLPPQSETESTIE